MNSLQSRGEAGIQRVRLMTDNAGIRPDLNRMERHAAGTIQMTSRAYGTGRQDRMRRAGVTVLTRSYVVVARRIIQRYYLGRAAFVATETEVIGTVDGTVDRDNGSLDVLDRAGCCGYRRRNGIRAGNGRSERKRVAG